MGQTSSEEESTTSVDPARKFVNAGHALLLELRSLQLAFSLTERTGMVEQGAVGALAPPPHFAKKAKY